MPDMLGTPVGQKGILRWTQKKKPFRSRYKYGERGTIVDQRGNVCSVSGQVSFGRHTVSSNIRALPTVDATTSGSRIESAICHGAETFGRRFTTNTSRCERFSGNCPPPCAIDE
jgi:hypothetical protein